MDGIPTHQIITNILFLISTHHFRHLFLICASNPNSVQTNMEFHLTFYLFNNRRFNRSRVIFKSRSFRLVFMSNTKTKNLHTFFRFWSFFPILNWTKFFLKPFELLECMKASGKSWKSSQIFIFSFFLFTDSEMRGLSVTYYSSSIKLQSSKFFVFTATLLILCKLKLL